MHTPLEYNSFRIIFHYPNITLSYLYDPTPLKRKGLGLPSGPRFKAMRLGDMCTDDVFAGDLSI